MQNLKYAYNYVLQVQLYKDAMQYIDLKPEQIDHGHGGTFRTALSELKIWTIRFVEQEQCSQHDGSVS